MTFYTKLAGIVSSLSHSQVTLARALAQREKSPDYRPGGEGSGA